MHKPFQLSIGKRQRAYVDWELLKKPRFILADERTSDLDSENTAEVLESFDEYNRKGGIVIVVTHKK